MKRWREAVFVVLAWAASAAYLFRNSWTTGFSKLIGNDGDTRLAMYLTEHWFLVLRGRASWDDPAFFYPARGVLGWTDTFVFFDVFYVPFHVLGADEFLAFELSLIAASLVGFAGFVMLARMLFQATLPIAIAGAFLFTCANNIALHAASTQLMGVYFVPGLVCIGIAAWRRIGVRPWVSGVLFAVLGVLYALSFFSFYYVTWLSTLAAVVLAISLLVTSRHWLAGRISFALRRGWRQLLALVVGFGVGIVPFLRVYLPALHEFGGRSYSGVLSYSPNVRDLLLLGGNLYWGTFSYDVARGYEKSYAITPILFLCVLVAGPIVLWRAEDRGRAAPRRRLGLALCITVVVLAVLPLRASFGSVWIVVWHLPGASAIRATDRLEIVAALLAALAFTQTATVFLRGRGHPRGRRVLPVVLVTILAVIVSTEQFNSNPTALVSRTAQLSLLDSVPRPPPECRSFFVTDTERPDMISYEFEIDAMLVSERVGLPTLNGYSGETPAKWGLYFPGKPSYRVFVSRWMARNHISGGVCDLDLGPVRWKPFTPGATQ